METGPEATRALLGGSRPPGSLLGPSDFAGPCVGRPRLPPAELPAAFPAHELSLAEPPEALGAPSSQAFLGFGGGGGLPPAEDPGPLLAGSHRGASPLPGTPRTAAAVPDSGFPAPRFLPGAPGHGSPHSPAPPAQGPALPGQPPLPEKKRASEGDRSFGSVSPSSSGFSSPHSGSTMSIPFPNVLPDFPKPPEAAAPSPGRCDPRRTVPLARHTGPGSRVHTALLLARNASWL